MLIDGNKRQLWNKTMWTNKQNYLELTYNTQIAQIYKIKGDYKLIINGEIIGFFGSLRRAMWYGKIELLTNL